jgi:hypothetical protein
MFPISVAVYETPEATELPSLNVAVTGALKTPNNPYPTPSTVPNIPFSFVF